jgi:hypothetical protein
LNDFINNKSGSNTSPYKLPMDTQNLKEEDLIRTMIIAAASMTHGSSKFTPLKKNTLEISKN